MERKTHMKKGTRYASVVATAALAAASLGMGVSAQAATQTVTINGGYSASDASAFQAELDAAFPASSGITVKYTSLASFDTDITTKIAAGQAPDIASSFRLTLSWAAQSSTQSLRPSCQASSFSASRARPLTVCQFRQT
jgi:ABC-type glycerol-3-phosphate transport system substrate-binding protein